jgi:hypothetical protein
VTKIRKRSIHEVQFLIKPRVNDLETKERGPCDPRSCKWKIAGLRSAKQELGPDVTKFWVDGGHIRFSHGGYRWQADTHKNIKADLIALDKWDRLSPEQKAVIPPPNDMKAIKVVARRMTKIVKTTPQQLRQMKERRAKRIERGEKDKKYPTKTLHERVVGFA